MSYCQKCGFELSKDTKFCPECGAPAGRQPKATPEPSGTDGKTLRRAGEPAYGVLNLEDLPLGHIIEDRYEIKEKLGQGSCGAVYRAYDLITSPAYVVLSARESSTTWRLKALLNRLLINIV